MLIQGNNLWVPQTGASGASVHYENMANPMGVELGGWSFGAQFGDLNNDGIQDLYLITETFRSTGIAVTGTTFRRLPAAIRPSSRTPPTGRRWMAAVSPDISRRMSG